MSNKLHTFADQDVKGRLKVIEEIKTKRQSWKEIMIKIDHFEKFGQLPITDQKPQISESEAELKLQRVTAINRMRKIRFEIKNKPSSPSVPTWQSDLDMLTAEVQEIDKQLIRLKYENSKPISG